jgi:hypothetical protein
MGNAASQDSDRPSPAGAVGTGDLVVRFERLRYLEERGLPASWSASPGWRFPDLMSRTSIPNDLGLGPTTERNSDDDSESQTDLNQSAGGLLVLTANCAANARV